MAGDGPVSYATIIAAGVYPGSQCADDHWGCWRRLAGIITPTGTLAKTLKIISGLILILTVFTCLMNYNFVLAYDLSNW